ncbi:MAG: YggS family pyridoxal phosphate-dependent enzyme [Candidatus Amulumruptor sp.]
MGIAERISAIRSTLADGVKLIAVSKFHPADAIMEAYNAGQRDFGESRVQELSAKAPSLPDDIHWHFIGHLQTNKVRQLIPHVDTIQSVDSLRLLRLIDSEAARIGRTVNVMMQVHVAMEETKFGFAPEELLAELTPDVLSQLRNVTVTGIMGMASNTDDTARVEADFEALAAVWTQLKDSVMATNDAFRELSMGMSHDYTLAMRHRATMVRIGTDIFGERQY